MEDVDGDEQDVLVLVCVRRCFVYRSQWPGCCFANRLIVNELTGVRVDVENLGEGFTELRLALGHRGSDWPGIVTEFVIADRHQQPRIAGLAKGTNHARV